MRKTGNKWPLDCKKSTQTTTPRSLLGEYEKKSSNNLSKSGATTKLLKIQTSEKIVVITLKFEQSGFIVKPEDHLSCIAHLIAEDVLKSAVIEEKKFKNIECKWFGPRSMTDLDLWYS